MEEFWKTYGGRFWLGIAAAILVLVIGGGFLVLRKLIPSDSSGVLPLLAIGGIILLILMLTFVAMIFSILGLTNDKQAMGLPEGSIRAVIALSLIVLFAILSVFLLNNISTGSRYTIPEMSNAERGEFIKSRTDARDINAVETKGKPGFYDVSYRSSNPASEDFAKQLLVLLGTLMTAVTSFYLGAGTATAAAKPEREASAASAAAASTSVPTFTDIKPTTHAIGANGSTVHLEATGTNLAGITGVKLVKAGATPIDGTKVAASATKIAYDFAVTNASVGTWSIEVIEGAKPAKAVGTLVVAV